MRPITLSLAAALLVSPVASARASAGGNHHGGHGGGHHGHGHGHGGGGGGNQPEATVQGAGQRLHFSFGGAVKLKGDKARGQFVLVVHPLAPQGNTLAVACKYNKFSQVVISATQATFRGEGRCERLLANGTFEPFDAVNVFQIVNGTEGPDSIDVNFVGPTGVAVPGGTLDFGDFNFDPV
jgi:hypothetical protein